MLIGISDQMGTRFDRLRYEVFQNLILSPMNTGLLRPAVATVLTVYGIETKVTLDDTLKQYALQQSLPFTVLKHSFFNYNLFTIFNFVATVLTVYGIETVPQRISFNGLKRAGCNSPYRLRY